MARSVVWIRRTTSTRGSNPPIDSSIQQLVPLDSVDHIQILLYWWFCFWENFHFTFPNGQIFISRYTSAHIVVDTYDLCQEVGKHYSEWYPIQLGGPDHYLQIDKSCFSHKIRYYDSHAGERKIPVLILPRYRRCYPPPSYLSGNCWWRFCPNFAAYFATWAFAWGFTIHSNSPAAHSNIRPLLGSQHAQIKYHDPSCHFMSPLRTKSKQSAPPREELTATH